MSYSERTKCPACKAKVRLQDVKFTPTFSCPACQEEIRVSPLYLKALKITSAALALFPAYILGADILGQDQRRSSMFLLVAVLWLLFGMVLTFLLTFSWLCFGRYLLPPKLLRPVADRDDRSHFQGLGLGPK